MKHSKESKQFLENVEDWMRLSWKGMQESDSPSLFLWVFDYNSAMIYRYDITNIKFNYSRIDAFDKYLEDQGHILEDIEFMLTDQNNFELGN